MNIMLHNFLLCLNSIAPIFLLIILGSILKKINIIDSGFTSKANNLVFRAALPCMLFKDIATINIASRFDARLVLTAVLVTVIMFFVSLILSIAVGDDKRKAAFAQGVFRSNYAILGLPLTKAFFPEEVAVNASVILAICVPLFNVLSVIILTKFLCSKGGLGSTLLGIAKNPLIIAAAAGALVSLVNIPVPQMIMTLVNYLSQLCIPLSLIVIGGSFVMNKAILTVRLAVVASLIKTVITPLVFIFPAHLAGISSLKLGVLYIFLAAPTAVTSYTMTRNMGGDYDLSGNIVMISTAMSFFSIFAGMFIMKTIGII